MQTRGDFMRAVDTIVQKTNSTNEQIALLQALLLVAASIANGISENSVGFSKAHVEESTDEMVEILERTFSVDLHSN